MTAAAFAASSPYVAWRFDLVCSTLPCSVVHWDSGTAQVCAAAVISICR